MIILYGPQGCGKSSHGLWNVEYQFLFKYGEKQWEELDEFIPGEKLEEYLRDALARDVQVLVTTSETREEIEAKIIEHNMDTWVESVLEYQTTVDLTKCLVSNERYYRKKGEK